MTFNRSKIGLLLGPLAALVFLTLPLQIPEQARLLAGIMIFCLVFWTTEALPLSITALLGVAFAIALGLADVQTAFAGIGHPVILLFIGSFLIARSMTKYGLDSRLALVVLSVPFFQKSLFRLFLGFSLLSFGMSMWISNTATVAILLPLSLGILQLICNDSDTENPLPGYLLLGIAYSASLGGTATLIGSPPNLIGADYLQQAGVPIDFFQWMVFGVPVALSLYLVLLVYVWSKIRKLPFTPERLYQHLQQYRTEREPLSRGEKNTLLVFVLAVLGWVLPGLLNLLGATEVYEWFSQRLPESMVALFCSMLLFMLPTGNEGLTTLNSSDIRRIDWDTILLFGGGIALGKLVIETGLAKEIADAISAFVSPGNSMILLLVLLTAIIFMTEVSSNTAVAITFTPILIVLMQEAGLPLFYPIVGLVIASSFAFMLPVATAPNAIMYGSGRIPIGKMVRTGLVLNLAGIVLLFLWIRIFM